MKLVPKMLHHFFKKFIAVILLFAFTLTSSNTNSFYFLAAPSAFQKESNPLSNKSPNWPDKWTNKLIVKLKKSIQNNDTQGQKVINAIGAQLPSLKEKNHRKSAFKLINKEISKEHLEEKPFVLLCCQIFVATTDPRIRASVKQLLIWFFNKTDFTEEEIQVLHERLGYFLQKLAQEKSNSKTATSPSFKRQIFKNFFAAKTDLILGISTLTFFISTLFTMLQLHHLKNKISSDKAERLEEKLDLEQSIEELQKQLTEMAQNKNTLAKALQEKEAELKQKIDELNQTIEKEKENSNSKQTDIEKLEKEKEKLFQEFKQEKEKFLEQSRISQEIYQTYIELHKKNAELVYEIFEFRELQRKTTFLPPLLKEIYFNPKFASKTEEFNFEAKWSIASAIHALLKRANEQLTETNIDTLIPFILEARKTFENRVLLDENSHLILIMHEDKKMFDPKRTIDFAKARGVKEKNIHLFVGTQDKEKALQAIESAPLGTTVWLKGHGGPHHFWLIDGEPGKEISNYLKIPQAISYEELALALSGRQKKQNGKLSDLVIINDSCYSTDQHDLALKSLSYFQAEATKEIDKSKKYLNSNENLTKQRAKEKIERYQFESIKDSPFMIAVTNRDMIGFNNFFLSGLEKVIQTNEKLTLRLIYQAEEQILFSVPLNIEDQFGNKVQWQDPTIQVPISEELLQKILKALNIKKLQDDSHSLEIGSLDKKICRS